MTPIGPFEDASQNSRQMMVQGAGTFNPMSIRIFAPAKLLYVVVNAYQARTAGTCTITGYKNGLSTGVSAVLDGTNTGSAQSALSSVAFAAGDQFSLVQANSSFTPATQLVAYGVFQFDAS